MEAGRQLLSGWKEAALTNNVTFWIMDSLRAECQETSSFTAHYFLVLRL
jgi:hypothetical protein